MTTITMAQQNNSGQKIAFDKKKGVNVVIPADQFDRAMASGRFEIAPESKPTPMETVVHTQRAANPLGRVDNFYDLTDQQASTLRQQADDVAEQNRADKADNPFADAAKKVDMGSGGYAQAQQEKMRDFAKNFPDPQRLEEARIRQEELTAVKSALRQQAAGKEEEYRKKREEAIERAYEEDASIISGLMTTDGAAGFNPARTYAMNTPDARAYDIALNMTSDANKIIEQADKNLNGGTAAGNTLRGLRDGVFDIDTWDMGINEMGANATINAAVAKFDKGQELSDSESAMLDALAIQLAASAYYGSDVGRGYKAGITTANALPFMAEMALNPLAASGKGIAKKIAQYGVKRFASRGAKTAVKAASRIAGDVAAATGMAVTTGLGDVAADTQRRMMGEHQFGIDEQGRVEYAGHTEGESFGTAAAKSTTARAIENFSEMTGNYFGAAGGLLKGTKVAQSLGRSKVAKVLRSIGNSNVGRVVRNIEQRAQYQGVLGEDLEEQINTVLNAAIVGDQKFSDLTDASKQLDTFLGVAMMGGFLSSVQAVGYATQAWGAQRNLSRADAEGQKLFGEQWGELKNAIDNDGSEADLEPAMEVLRSNDYTRKQKDALMNYSQSLNWRNGVVMAENTAPPELRQMQESYQQGEAASEATPEQKQVIRSNYIVERSRLGEQRANELDDVEDVADYIEQNPETRPYFDSKALYDGLVAGTQTQIEEQVKTAVDAVAANAHPDGNIYEAQTRDGRGGMIVSGDIVRDSAGNVDAAKSGDRVVIRRDDGTTDMVPTSDIETILSAEPAAAVQEQAAAIAREQAYSAAAQEIEGEPAQFDYQQEISVGGVRGVIDNPRNADGDVEVTFDDYVDIPGHGSRMAHFLSPETLRALSAPTTAAPTITQEQSPAPAAQDQTAQVPAPTPPSEQGISAQIPSQAEIEPEPVPAVEDVAPEAYEAVPAAPVFPTNKEGDIDFNAITEPADYAAALQQEFGAEAADTAAEMLADANADLATAKASKKGTAVDRRRAINKAAAELARYQQVVDILNPTPVAATSADAAPVAAASPVPAPAVAPTQAPATAQPAPTTSARKSKKQTAPKQPKVPREPQAEKEPSIGELIAQWGEPQSIEEVIQRDLSTDGVRFIWNDQGVRRGMARELGFMGNEVERRKRIPLFRNSDGVSPDQYAEQLYGTYGRDRNDSGYGQQSALIVDMDDTQIKNIVLDALLNFTGRNAAAENLRAMHTDIEIEQAAYAEGLAEYAREQAEEEWIESMGEAVNFTVPIGDYFAENFVPLQNQSDSYGNNVRTNDSGISESGENPSGALVDTGELQRLSRGKSVGTSDISLSDVSESKGRQGEISERGQDLTGDASNQTARGLRYGRAGIGRLQTGDNSRLDEGVRGERTGRGVVEQSDIRSQDTEQAISGNETTDVGYATESPVGGTAGTSVSGLSGSEQRAGDQVAAQIDARIEELRAELTTARKRYAAEKSRVGQAYSQDNQASLFGDTAAAPADGALFDVPRDTSQANTSRILRPLLDDITRIENAISELNTSRDKAVADAIEAERTQLKIADAEAATDTAPTEGQKQWGNYKKGHVTVQGFDITIENPRGSVRSGVAPDGSAWRQTMNNTYGYFKRTKGKDGDQIDVFLGDNPTSSAVFVVDQINPDGSFDEHKVMLGFDTEEQARAAYLANYEDGWQGLGNITTVGVEAFRRWLDNGTRKRKPFAEYAASPKPASNAQPTSGLRKIEDFGEKIGGARKDLAAEYRKTLSEITNSDIQNQPLSKTFPRPNYKALVESGALTQDNALYLSYLHDNIPTKPRNSRELRRWAPVVQMSIDEAQSVLEHNDVDHLAALREKILQRHKHSNYYKANEPYTPSDEELLMLDDAWLRVETLRALGFPSEDVKLGDARIRFFIRDRNTFRLTIGKKYIEHFFSFNEAIDALGKKLDSPAKKTSTFNIYTNRRDRSIIFIGKPVQGKEPVRLTENFATVQEASNYLRDHRDELQIKWDAMSVAPEERRAVNRERRGTDWRDGVDVTPEKFRDQFGFRGTEFGNWVNQKERQKALNDAYDGLMDLSQVLSVSPRALSLGGELAMAFGARGKGVAGGIVASAHYEPDRIVINITKTRGAGSLAHEWWHALDNYFSRKGGKTDEFFSDGSRQMNDQVRQEMKSAFDDLMKSISDSGLLARSAGLDSQRSKSYWASRYEMSARAFENYVAERIAANGGSNDYLVNFKDLDQWVLQGNFDAGSYPYPTVGETPAINERFDQLFETIEEKVDAESGNTILFRDGAESGERAEIEGRTKADGTWLKASNGAKTHLTPEQWVTVRTQAFKNWFGDWENTPEDSSKVVDENGEPLVVAHSTDHEFTAFKNMQENDAGWLGAGYYFFGDRSLDRQYGWNVMQVFLNIREPYNIDYNEVKELSDLNKKSESRRFSSNLASEGYDGVYFNGNLNQEYAVFNPNQIKSATDNVGTFDAGSNDIRFREEINEQDRRLSLLQELQYIETGETKVKNGKLLQRVYVPIYVNDWYNEEDSDPNSEDFDNVDDALQDLYVRGRESSSAYYEPYKETIFNLDPAWVDSAGHIIEDDGDRITYEDFAWDNPNNEFVAMFGYRNNEQIIGIKSFKSREAGSRELEGDVYMGIGNDIIKKFEVDGKELHVMRNGRGKYTSINVTDSEGNEVGSIGLRIANHAYNPQNNSEEERNGDFISVEIANKNETAGRFGGKLSMQFDDSNSYEEVISAVNKRIEEIVSSWSGVRFRDRSFGSAEQVNTQFNNELRQQIEGTLPKGHIYSLGRPSDILLAAGIPNLPIEMAATRLNHKSNQDNHPFNLTEVENLPQAVHNPLAVFRSATHIGSNVILTELTQGNKNFVVAIETNRVEGRIQVNSVRSIHPRTTSNVITWINDDLMDYADKIRLPIWLNEKKRMSRNTFGSIPANAVKQLNSATKIVQEFQNPTIPAKIIEPTLDQEITSAVQDAARSLNVDVQIVEDASEITDDNPDVQRRKRAAKGWFDTATNQITIIAPNHTTPNDAVATLMHEAVGHYGLRQLLGADFNAFLRQVYNEGSTETRREIFRLSLGLGGNLDLAAEEYIAGLAEEGLRNPIAGATTTWARIRDAFRALLRRLGITVHFTDADLNYMLWKSYNRLREGDGIIDTARKIATDAELVRFREQEPLSLVQQQYEERLGRTVRILPKWAPWGRGAEVNLFKLTEAYQDSMLAVKELMNVVLDSDGKPLRNGEDAYMAENHMSSKSGAETEVYMGNFFTPMMKSVAGLMSAGGMEYEDVLRYILAKHGLERNEVFAMRDAQRVMDERVKALDAERKQGLMEEGEYEERIKEFEDQRQVEFEENRAKDYSGLTSLVQEDTDEDSINTATAEERAAEIVAAVEAQNGVEVDSMWRAINDATKATLRKQFESGLLTKAQYGALQNMFKFYVPLRGWEEQTAADVWDYMLSERSSFNGGAKTAKGRRSVADDPISTIGNMAESAILQGNRNLMKQRFYKFALNHKTPLLSVTGQWYQNLGTPLYPLWEQSLPNIPDDATAEEIADAIEIHEKQMRTLEKDGMAKLGREGLTLPYRALTPEKNEHIVQGKTAGREWVVYVNGNPRAAQAINGTNVIKPQTRWGKNFARFNRQLSANYTTRNPAFVLGNMTRDMIFSSAAIYIKEDGAYTRRYAKNLAGNTKGLWGSMYRLNSGTLDPGNARDMYLQEFVMNGGETGHTALHSVDEYKKMVARKIVDLQGKVDLGRVFGFEAGRATTGNSAVVKTVGGLQAMGKGLSFMNRCAEDVSRLSVYMTSRQMGRTVEQSIADAKEVSVNFNKKGAGGMGASTFKALYLFFNAAVQSLANFTRLAKKSPPKFSAVIGGYMAMGALLPIVNAFLLDMIGDDDDAYNNLPDWIRRNNFCIPLSGGNFLTIPLPIELRAFYGMGEMFYQTAAGNMRHRNVPLEAVGQIADLMPLNVLGENGQVFTGDPKDLIGIFMPESAKPIWQVVVNKDFFGKPIFRDTDYNKQMPAYTKAYKGTNGFLVWSAELLNEVTGGDKYTQGAINVNPATWEHVFEGYFGGTAKTINQAGKTISMIWNEDQRVTRNIPVVSRFVSSTDERNAFARVNEEYFKFLDEYTITQQRLRGYENEADLNVLEYAEKQNLLHNSPAYERYLIMHDTQKEIRELNKLIKETADKKERDVWEMELNLTKEQLVDELNAIEK